MKAIGLVALAAICVGCSAETDEPAPRWESEAFVLYLEPSTDRLPIEVDAVFDYVLREFENTGAALPSVELDVLDADVGAVPDGLNVVSFGALPEPITLRQDTEDDTILESDILISDSHAWSAHAIDANGNLVDCSDSLDFPTAIFQTLRGFYGIPWSVELEPCVQARTLSEDDTEALRARYGVRP